MSELSVPTPTPRVAERTDRIIGLAERQWGVLTRNQLENAGLSGGAISRWIEQRRLFRVLPRVYVLGQRTLRVEARLTAALFYAGKGAALSHLTAAWWWRMLDQMPEDIHVSAPGDTRSLPGIRVHHPRLIERIRHRGFPVTPPARALLDSANQVSLRVLRKMLAEGEYQRLLRLEDDDRILGRGLPGSANLHAAFELHRRQLAHTKSVLEERFLELCERYGIPIPDVNVEIAGFVVDAVWHRQRVIVELDGVAAHRHRLQQDHARDLALRAAGYVVLRYTWQQIAEQPELVAADLLSHL